MEAAQQHRTFKIIVAGASGVGKSCFIRRRRSGEFEARYIATMGAEVYPLAFHTTHGLITFKMWDLAGDPKFAGLGDGYYAGADGLLVFYDLTSPGTLVTACDILDAHLGGGGMPFARRAAVLCGAKQDRTGGAAATMKPYPKVPYFEVSARSCYNYEKPFLSLARQLTGDPELDFVDAPALVPPTVSVGPACPAGGREVPFNLQTVNLDFQLDADSSYDGLGEPLREALEELLVEAGLAGYGADVRVAVNFKRRERAQTL